MLTGSDQKSSARKKYYHYHSLIKYPLTLISSLRLKSEFIFITASDSVRTKDLSDFLKWRGVHPDHSTKLTMPFYSHLYLAYFPFWTWSELTRADIGLSPTMYQLSSHLWAAHIGHEFIVVHSLAGHQEQENQIGFSSSLRPLYQARIFFSCLLLHLNTSSACWFPLSFTFSIALNFEKNRHFTYVCISYQPMEDWHSSVQATDTTYVSSKLPPQHF